MTRAFKVSLGGICPWLIAADGNLSARHQRYIPQPTHYSLFWLEHAGSLAVNGRSVEYGPGSMAFVVPGVRFEFERTGPGTPHAEFTFDLISKSEIVAVPAIHHFGDETETRRREVQASLDWLGVSIMRGLGCVFNLLWAVAQPARVGTRSDIVFSVEDIISQRLSEKINIGDIANELAISHVHLLRLFREEHGTTIQEYLRRMRLEQARHLIIATDMPLKEIASRTGMPDLQYFNKIVRDETGLSPRGLRAQPANREIH